MKLQLRFINCLIIIIVLLYCQCVIGIKLNNNRYEDVNIIVQDTVEENPKLIERIKEVFTDVSQFLFKATKHRVYLGKINIVLPQNWTSQYDYEGVPALPQGEGYIMIDNGELDTPHVKPKDFKCGHEGLYMYLTPSFIISEPTTKWGKHANVIVHEWGRLRWGIFEEYRHNKALEFYLDQGLWKPAQCSEQIQGRIGTGNNCLDANEICDASDTTRKMPNQCRFCPDKVQAANSSIMTYQYIDSITQFCDKNDDTVPEWQRHNPLALNKQNLICRRKSAWEVMRAHADFNNGNSQVLPDGTDTTPQFRVIQERTSESYRVFVLDTSGSMNTADRITTLYETGKYIIQEKLPLDSWLGIVWFSTIASEKKALTQITSESVKHDLIGSLPTTATGGTCIGCGINLAISMLEAATKSLTNSEIILLSDGDDSNENALKTAMDVVALKGVIVHTISISQAADQVMIDLADISSGRHLSYMDAGSISLAAVFSEAISTGMTTLGSEPTTLLSEKNTTYSQSLQFSFSVERGMTTDTRITVITGSDVNIVMTVVGPYNFSEVANKVGKSMTFALPSTAQPGHYEVNVSSSVSTTWEYLVKSTPSEQNTIQVTSRVAPSKIDFSTGQLPVVIAEVTKGRAPVTNVEVSAVVEAGSSSCNIMLKDAGQDPDIIPNDGTYTGYILRNCLGSGRINVKVYVKGEAGKALVVKGMYSAISPDEEEISENPVEDSFQRMSITEEVFVTNYNAVEVAVDTTEPGRITDVSIVDISTEMTDFGESRNFTITWTATGDDKNMGNATEYEIRVAESIDNITNDFSNADFLDMGNTTLVPQQSGNAEAIKISVDAKESYTSTAFLAIVAKDEAGNVGDISNVISILVAKGYRVAFKERTVFNYTEMLIRDENRFMVTTENPVEHTEGNDMGDGSYNTTSKMQLNNEDDNNDVLIVWVTITVVVCVVVFAFLGIIIYKKCLRKKSNGNDVEFVVGEINPSTKDTELTQEDK